METAHLIQLAIAVYLVVFGSIMQTKNITSSIVFKVLPLCSAFLLGLIAFKVIA